MTLSEALDQLGIERAPTDHHHRTSGWESVDCPYCSPNSHHFRLGINIRWGYCNCWVCGRHRLTDSLQTLSGLPWQVVKQTLALVGLDEGLSLPRTKEVAGKLSTPPYTSLRPCQRCYLQNRGFNPDRLAKLWGVTGIGLHKRLAWRIFIPITYRGVMVSWTTRAIADDAKSRYVSARPSEEVLSHKDLLYGHDFVRHAAIVVEGPIDAWRIGPGAVATFGTGWRRPQLLKLAKIPIRTIAFDREPEAQRRARKLARELAAFPGRTEVVEIDVESNSDPGSATLREVQRLRRIYLRE